MRNLTFDMIKPLVPKRPEDSHKGSYGRVLALCGSDFYRGAAALSCLGALKVGSGIVCLASPECVIESIASMIPEAIFIPLPNDALLLERAEKYDSILMGCGLSEETETLITVRRLLTVSKGTVILDAGALMSCGKDLTALSIASERVIITPHLGEMARLLGKEIGFVKENAEFVAKNFALQYGVTVVLKSHKTIIASPGGETFINTTGNPGLAKGGSGDVLAGMIAGFAAQGLTPLESAQAGVFLHGFAADVLAQKKSMQAMLPHQIPEALEEVFLKL